MLELPKSYNSPVGNKSNTCTPVVSKGPKFINVIVNVIVSPIVGVALSIVFVRLKSAEHA